MHCSILVCISMISRANVLIAPIFCPKKVAACTDLALKYNDQSVLENHHIAVALSILTSEKFSFLQTLKPLEYDHLRRVIIETVLATDMSKHTEICSQFDKVCIPNLYIIEDLKLLW